MATREIYLGEFAPGSVDRLRFTIKKDGVAWQGIDSAVLTFEQPSREEVPVQFSRPMLLENDVLGIWYYDTAVTDLATSGYWSLGLVVTDGAVVKKYAYEISLLVLEEP